MKSPKISIIIPTFNKVNYIEKTLLSIINQKYDNLEIIVQDGGSTDGTYDIVKKYKSKYPKLIKSVSKKDNGQLDAINKGIKKSTGKIVAYINADDIYLPGAFKTVSNYYHKYTDAFWFAGRGLVIGKDDEMRNSFFYKVFVKSYKNILLLINWYPLLLGVNYIMQPSVFITRKTIEKFGLFDGVRAFVMEYEYWLRIGKTHMPVVINKDLSAFRLSGDNISSLQYESLLDEDMKVVRKYTANPLVLLIHKFNNLGRVFTIRH